MKQTDKIQNEISSLREELLKHELYAHLQTLDDLQIFMQHHVFAVWDFMSLLKALQINLTCTTLPWVPKGNPATRRMINEIVLGEETDVDTHGKPASHFELYVEAMQQVNASAEKINELIQKINQGKLLTEAINSTDVANSIKEFVKFTFEVIEENKTHEIAAAFTFGREDLIPDLFRGLVSDLNTRFPNKLGKTIYYLDRHIEVDDGVHDPLAMQMIEELCGDNQQMWNECLEVSKQVLQKRIALWDGILAAVKENKKELAG
jgi:hypothetical protein